MKILAGMVAGFLASFFLYRPTHREGFPELARYAIGGLLVVLVHGILYPPGDQERERLFAALAAAGLGVAAARLWGLLQE
jgi:hypothetical protein